MAEGVVVLLTGLPSAGKSTIALRAAETLRGEGHRCEVLDGDVVRRSFWPELGMAPQDRGANLLRFGQLAGLLARNGVLVLVAVIAPYAHDRATMRKALEDNGITFVEVHVTTPVAECRRRDVKGLYARQARGEITGLTGVDAVYEPPAYPELRIDTTGSAPADSVSLLLNHLTTRGALRRDDTHDR